MLPPGCLVVIDHPDLDSVAARMLVAARPLAVVNCQRFVTGRYPNRGPSVLLDAGVALFETDDDLFARATDGQRVRLDGGTLILPEGLPCPLQPLTATALAERLAAARMNLNEELGHFVQNTLTYLARNEERVLLLDPVTVPDIAIDMAGRHALIVVRGDGYEDDLERLAPYLREERPVVIAVDGAADALRARGIRPHVILGDMDSVSDESLRCGAALVVHAYVQPRSGTAAPGLARVQSLGLDAVLFPVAGTSEDAALLLADEKGADLIVAVGTHTHLEDFLDKGRGGMASTFLVRLKVGRRLIDARGVSRLYARRGRPGWLLLFLTLSALFPVIILAASTPFGQIAWRSIVVWFRLVFR
jgi:uncharacterized membrane-anchored protein